MNNKPPEPSHWEFVERLKRDEQAKTGRVFDDSDETGTSSEPEKRPDDQPLH